MTEILGRHSMAAQSRWRLLLGLAALLPLFLLTACGVNAIPTYEEQAKAAWSQVLNQYQRRADLVPNLVETVKGYAAHESETLQAIVEARSKVTQTQIPADILTNPKANQNFLALQSQLEGTENRISVARRDYIEAVRLYNTELKTIPGRWWKAMLYPDAQPMENFTVAADVINVPKVDFGTGTTGSSGSGSGG
jgi:LemA protein